jgi:hypothetical protein
MYSDASKKNTKETINPTTATTQKTTKDLRTSEENALSYSSPGKRSAVFEGRDERNLLPTVCCLTGPGNERAAGKVASARGAKVVILRAF